MKNLITRNIWILLMALVIIGVQSCSPAGENNPGSEYMPDMFHSIAYEANLDDYYSFNTWGEHKDYFQVAQPRKPVPGTIPFGEFALKDGQYDDKMEKVIMDLPANGYVPFHFENTEEGRTAASQNLIDNPFPITEEALNAGKQLYTTYCAICHGDKGDGLGYLVRDDGGVYPVAPANLIDAKFVDTTVGALYFAIEYGKNAMSGYADKLSYKERWDVIHYIRSLQSGDMEYSALKNTFKPGEALTEKDWKAGEESVAEHETIEEVPDESMHHGSHENH